MINRLPPPAALVLTATISVQFGAALATTLFDELGPSGAAVYRIGLAAVILCVIARPSLHGLDRADVKLLVAYGLALGVMNTTFYEALERIPLGVAVTIEFAGPLGVAVALSRRRLDLVWVVLAAAGILLLARPWDAGAVDPLGLVFVAIAAACWAAYILLAARTGGRFEGLRGIALAMVVATFVPIVPGVAQAGGELLVPSLIAIGIGVAVLSSVIPYGLELTALRRMPRNVFAVLMSLEPAMAAAAGFIVLGQALGALELVAIGLVVCASVGASVAGPPADDGDSAEPVPLGA